MTTEPHQPASASRRLVIGWHTLRDGYRYANLLSHHVLGFVFKSLIVAYFVFCGVFLSLRYLVLPNIDSYKGNIEQIASKAVGQPVSIARIYASWHGIRPNLFLGDVVLRDKDGRQALTLPSVSATLSWWSLFAADVRFNSLEIIRPDLDIRREADGKLYVAGMFVDPNKGGDGKGFDWVLSQREIVIREGRVRWTDAKRDAPELALEGVNLALHNRWRRHQFGLKAIPPADLSAPLDVRANFVHPAFARRISDVRLWKGQLYLDLGATDLSVWKRYVDYPIEVPQGKGSVRAWLNLDQSKVADFTADLKLSNVSARLRKDLPLLNLAQVGGRISAQEKFDRNAVGGMPTFGAHGYALALTDFSLQTEDGLVLPTTTINTSFVPAKKGVPEKTEIRARVLELQTLANFAGHLPLAAAQRQLLADFAPRGQLRDFSAQWQGSYPNIVSYNVKGQFSGLSLAAQPARVAQPKIASTPALAAVPAIPGFDNLTGRVDANDRGGQFSLASAKLVLQMPGYFAEPAMPFDSLNMQANWVFQGQDQVLFQIDRMDFVQDGLHGSLSGKHLVPLKPRQGKSLSQVDLTGHFSGFDVKKSSAICRCRRRSICSTG
ncbi:YhdP family protein [Undibacterium arcticum]|uniref:YhdP family phospholipid transporter n=1 Tax=Undibacterium arcticum TaxID=1762892 RepID=UPI00362243C8